MPVTKIQPVTKGKQTKVTGALLKTGERSEPNPVTLTASAAAIKGATTVSVTAAFESGTETLIAKGQYLLFEDTDEKGYLVQVDADYESGTTLTVKALAEALPDDAAAVFPVPFKLRTDSGISFSQDVSDVNTYDHSVNGDASPGAATIEISLEGEYSPYDPGYATAVYATRNTQEMYIIRELATPGAGFSKGKVTKGACLITSREEPAPNDGNVGANVSARFVGDVEENDPTPTA